MSCDKGQQAYYEVQEEYLIRSFLIFENLVRRIWRHQILIIVK